MGANGSYSMGGASLVNSAGSLATSISQAGAARAQGEYQKQQYETNARLADLQAKDAIDRGDKDAAAVHKKGLQVQGAQRAALAAQGIDVGSGSALEIQLETGSMARTEAAEVRNNAWREAWGYKVQANNYRGQGTMADLASQNQSRNTLLTGGLQALEYGARGASTFSFARDDKKLPKVTGLRASYKGST